MAAHMVHNNNIDNIYIADGTCLMVAVRPSQATQDEEDVRSCHMFGDLRDLRNAR